MGLPSGLKWAPMNLDARHDQGFAISPFQYDCSFVSWGNVDSHYPISENTFAYDWGGVNSQAPWYDGQIYGSTPGSELNTNIDIAHDVAHQMCGDKWRMPTKEEFKELLDNCDYVQADGTTVIDAGQTDKRVTVKGVLGVYLKSKINGNLIFFSCSGLGIDTRWGNRGSGGHYWSVSFISDRLAYGLSLSRDGIDPQFNFQRFYGFSVRPVYDESISPVGLNVSHVDGLTIEPTIEPTSKIESNE